MKEQAKAGKNNRFMKENLRREHTYSGEQTRDSDSAGSYTDNEEEDLQTIKLPSELSLMLNDDPHNAMVLMLYLKRYSELLFTWGERARAIEACKLVASAYNIFTEYQKSRNAVAASQNDEEMTLAIQESDQEIGIRSIKKELIQPRKRFYHDKRENVLQEIPEESDKLILASSTFGQGDSSKFDLVDRPLNLCDFLLYSDRSLNYLQEVRLEPRQSYQKKYPP